MNPPTDWLNNLPIYNEGVTADGWGIFTGTIDGYKNICISISDGVLHVLVSSGSGIVQRPVWVYNEESGNFVTQEITSSGVAGQIINLAGLKTIEWGAGVVVNTMYKSLFGYKLLEESI